MLVLTRRHHGKKGFKVEVAFEAGVSAVLKLLLLVKRLPTMFLYAFMKKK